MAGALGWSPSKVSRIEHGSVKATTTDIRRLLDLYEVAAGDRPALLALARQGAQLGWWHEYSDVLPEAFGSFVDLEAEASAISNYEQSDIPGLLQTEDYARAQLRAGQFTDSDAEIERRVEARIARQDLLYREHPPRLVFVLDESAVRRLVGGAEVMRKQLQQLIDFSSMLTVMIGVVPYSAGAHAAPISFALFDFDGEDPTVVYCGLLGGSLYVEKPEAIAMYRAAFEAVLAAACSPAESARLLATIAKEM